MKYENFDMNADKSNMHELIKSWPEQIKRSWKEGFSSGRKNIVDPPRALVWAGMGGSAIGGDFCATLCRHHSSFPVLVHRGGNLPAWLGKQDRMIAVSFSGNTAETLESIQEAKSRGVNLDLLTSGGKVKQWAEKNSLWPWIIPGNRPPRAALGDLFGYAFGTMCGRNWLPFEQSDLEEAVKVLEMVNSKWEDPILTQNGLMMNYIDLFKDRIPFIYGTGNLVPVARRWACQINENAKTPAHWGELPEMNHNEVVAYIKGCQWPHKSAIVFLEDPDAPQDIQSRVIGTEQIATEAGWQVMIQRPLASSPFARMMEMTAIGDWLSYWMALEKCIDPTPIEPIDKLKNMLSGI